MQIIDEYTAHSTLNNNTHTSRQTRQTSHSTPTEKTATALFNEGCALAAGGWLLNRFLSAGIHTHLGTAQAPSKTLGTQIQRLGWDHSLSDHDEDRSRLAMWDELVLVLSCACLSQYSMCDVWLESDYYRLALSH